MVAAPGTTQYKELTCYFWATPGENCTLSPEECSYAHHDTGTVAPRPNNIRRLGSDIIFRGVSQPPSRGSPSGRVQPSILDPGGYAQRQIPVNPPPRTYAPVARYARPFAPLQARMSPTGYGRSTVSTYTQSPVLYQGPGSPPQGTRTRSTDFVQPSPAASPRRSPHFQYSGSPWAIRHYQDPVYRPKLEYSEDASYHYGPGSPLDYGEVRICSLLQALKG